MSSAFLEIPAELIAHTVSEIKSGVDEREKKNSDDFHEADGFTVTIHEFVGTTIKFSILLQINPVPEA